jgi:hypothetical protein
MLIDGKPQCQCQVLTEEKLDEIESQLEQSTHKSLKNSQSLSVFQFFAQAQKTETLKGTVITTNRIIEIMVL